MEITKEQIEALAKKWGAKFEVDGEEDDEWVDCSNTQNLKVIKENGKQE